ncbi:MAG: HAMP domain-containing sensor histidine kinase [Pseudomonadota bacterium]
MSLVARNKILSKASRLLKTTTFRLALVLLCLFTLLVALAMYGTQRALGDRIESLVDSRLRLESDLLISFYQSGSLPQLMNAIQQRNQIDEFGRFYYLANQADRAAGMPGATAPDQPAYLTMALSSLVDSVPPGMPQDLPVRVAITDLDDGLTLYIAHEITDELSLSSYFSSLVMASLGLCLLVALAAGVWASSSVIRRVDGISRAAGDIIEGDLSRRLRVTDDGNEFDQLASRINLMLNRIEELMSGMREVTSNIAHDLRSPLTRLRNRLDLVSLDEMDQRAVEETLSRGVQDADGLIETFNSLLSIARMEAGLQQARFGDVSITGLLTELYELYQPLAEDRGLDMQLVCDGDVQLRCDRHLFAQAISNLLDNALKYGSSGGSVTLGLKRPAGKRTVEISVEDRGTGIPFAARERVFQRFFRLEYERNTPGNGLGLSVVRAIVRMHRGEVMLLDNHPGLRAVMTFPLPSEQANPVREVEGRSAVA